MTRALALLGCLLLALAAPAAAHTQALSWTVTDASMSEHVTWHGDGGPACLQAGVCGFSGTVDYGFGGILSGDGILAFAHGGRGRKAVGFVDIFANGLTKAVVNPPGGGPPCTAQVLHRFDQLGMIGTSGRVRLSFHDPRFDGAPLFTYCTGPSDKDLWHAHAIPRISLPGRALRRRHLTLRLASTRSFHSGPFAGVVTFNAVVQLRRTRPPASLLRLIIG